MKCKRPSCDNHFDPHDGKPRSGRPRAFCSDDCRKTYWTEARNTGVGAGNRTSDHKITDVDQEARTGTCRQCGHGVKVYKSKRGDQVRWRCAARVSQQPSVVDPKPHSDPIHQRLVKLRCGGVKISREEYLAAVESAGGRCQLCGRESQLHVDHCHTTGRFRGLLCSTCNTGMGKFGDDPARIRAAADYLEANT